MDEPFSALDGVIKESVKERVRAIAREFSLTTIIVTHDPEEALTLSDRVLIINNGKVAQFGAPREIVKNPASAFVRDFILGQLRIRQENLSALFGGDNA
jgi:iron(III) transport system ATP-binding protein